jgi:uncharacterized protein with FMN-binding domain
MKRALLIAGGTVGGLGAVLAITPPQLGTTSAINIAGGPVTGPGATSSASASSSPSASASATTKATATKSAKPGASKSSGATAAATTEPAATAEATTAPATTAPATNSKTSINGTFTGPSINVNYGNVQVKITVVNGRITDAVAVKAPSGKNDRYTNMAVPTLKAQTLKAQSANIQGVSGASYTSYGWYTSLQGALAQAGL